MRYQILWFVLLVGGFLGSGDGAWAGEKSSIRVLNHEAGSTVRYPVVLLRGELDDANTDVVTVINESSKRPNRQLNGHCLKGRFKVLCELLPGENQLVVKSGRHTTRLTLKYQPPTSAYLVRVIYMTDSTGKTAYQSPFSDDPKDFTEKLDTAMKLMQMMTAERMHDLGFGRRTFNLEYGSDGMVKVNIFQGAQKADDYYQLSDQKWWQRVYAEVEKPFPTAKGKNVVIAAYTRFDPKTKKMLGHTALGGGGLGLFGSGNLFTWPTTLADVPKAFLDARRIDRDRFMDDSAFRGMHWAAASTTMGATLHELGHTFGLPHTNQPADIMTRGFDHFNRVFTVAEPDGKGGVRPFPEDRIACFAPISAAALVTSPWFAADDRDRTKSNTVQLRFDAQADTIVATSKAGIRYLGVIDKGDMKYFTAPPQGEKAPAQWRASLKDVRKVIAGDDFSVVAIDEDGHRKTMRWQDLKLKSTQ